LFIPDNLPVNVSNPTKTRLGNHDRKAINGSVGIRTLARKSWQLKKRKARRRKMDSEEKKAKAGITAGEVSHIS
jgi:hypothetical protein